MTLKDALNWLAGSGVGVAVWWLMDNVPWLLKLRADWRRYAALALAALLASGAYALSVALGYNALPADAQAWIEALFAVSFAAIVTSQAIHGATALRR